MLLIHPIFNTLQPSKTEKQNNIYSFIIYYSWSHVFLTSFDVFTNSEIYYTFLGVKRGVFDKPAHVPLIVYTSYLFMSILQNILIYRSWLGHLFYILYRACSICDFKWAKELPGTVQNDFKINFESILTALIDIDPVIIKNCQNWSSINTKIYQKSTNEKIL